MKDAVANAAAGVTLRTLPQLPDRIKRLLLGHRSITIDGNTLDTTLQLLRAIQRAAGGGVVSTDDVVAARTQLDALTAAMKQDISVAEVTNLSIPGPAGAIPARHYRPDAHAAEAGRTPAILVFYHGGGYTIGSIDSHDAQCRLICRDGGVHVLSIGYRLAPEHKFPAGVVDAFAAYRWALDNAVDLGADPERVVVGGDSAGVAAAGRGPVGLTAGAATHRWVRPATR